MRPSTFLRIASVVTMLYFLGHTSGIPWTPDVGPNASPMLDTMRGYSFEVFGSSRTYWDFYIGFGTTISLFLVILGVVLWQLGSLAKADAPRTRPLVASFFIMFLVNSVLAGWYFFVIPLVMSIVITACLGAALALSGRATAPE